MFHAISRGAASVLAPGNALVLLIIAGLLISQAKRGKVLGRRMIVAGVAALCFVAVVPLGDWLLTPLETRFAPFRPDGAPVAGIIVLGGSVSEPDAPWFPRPQPDEAADRMFVAAELARAFPQAPVIVSGGPVDPVTHASEADVVARYLMRMGVGPERLLRERRSRDTFENAQFTALLVRPQATQRWLLVTSAFHMPRAMGCFRHAGFNVTAAPADWRGNRKVFRRSWSASGNLSKLDLAAKEYIGLAVYKLRGRTAVLLPRP